MRLVQSALEQLPHDVDAALLTRHAQHGASVGVDHVDRAAPQQQEAHHVGVTHADGGLQRRASRPLGVIHVSVVLEQQFAHAHVTFVGAHDERRHELVVLVIDVSAALEQQRHHVGVRVAGGHAERRYRQRRAAVDVGVLIAWMNLPGMAPM